MNIVNIINKVSFYHYWFFFFFFFFVWLVSSSWRTRASLIDMHDQLRGTGEMPCCHCFHPEMPPTQAAAQILHGSVTESTDNSYTSVNQSLVLKKKQAGRQAWMLDAKPIPTKMLTWWTADGYDITLWQGGSYSEILSFGERFYFIFIFY